MSGTTPESVKEHEALMLEKEGDHLKAEGRLDEAFARYRESERLDDSRPQLYTKLVDLHATLTEAPERDWTEGDMNDLLYWTMRLQELQTPRLAYLREHLKGDYREVGDILQQLMITRDDAEEGRLLAELEALQERAIRPLLHFLLSLKHGAPFSEGDEKP